MTQQHGSGETTGGPQSTISSGGNGKPQKKCVLFTLAATLEDRLAPLHAALHPKKFYKLYLELVEQGMQAIIESKGNPAPIFQLDYIIALVEGGASSRTSLEAFHEKLVDLAYDTQHPIRGATLVFLFSTLLKGAWHASYDIQMQLAYERPTLLEHLRSLAKNTAPDDFRVQAFLRGTGEDMSKKYREKWSEESPATSVNYTFSWMIVLFL